MSDSFTAWLETQLLAHVYNDAIYTPPAATYAGLYTTAPTYTGGGTEVSAPEYVRIEATWSAVTGTPPYALTNNRLEWPCASERWGLVMAIAILDAPTAGNMLASAILMDPADGVTPRPRQIDPGNIFFIEIGGLMVAFQTPTTSAATRSRMTASQTARRRPSR